MLARKRAQSAIEFLVIFTFIFVIAGVIIYVIGLFSLDVVRAQNEAELNNFAKSIESEVALLQKVSGGFNRTVEVPDYLVTRYNVTLIGEYLVLKPLEFEGTDTDTEFWYPLPGEQPYYILNEDRDINGINETYLVMYKNQINATTRVLN